MVVMDDHWQKQQKPTSLLASPIDPTWHALQIDILVDY